MNSFEDNIRKVEPYVPGEQPRGEGIIKLNTNENPYPPSPAVEKAIRNFDYDNLRKYPDPDMSELRSAIGKYHNMSEENVFVGIGSDDVLSLSFLTFFNSNKPVVFADITYSFYEVWANLYKIPYSTIPLREDFSISKAEYAARNGGIVLANPNAPTGLALNMESISQMIYLNPDVVVIVDEAYVDFHTESAIDLIPKYDNLLVVRTFSKSRSLAGIRIGYALGSKRLISHLMAVRNSYNSYTINPLTTVAGVASIKDDSYFKGRVKEIVRTREWFKSEMAKLGFLFPKSSANFLFAKHEEVAGKQLFEELRRRNIYVRYFDRPRIDEYLRITIGTDEEMEILLDALRRML